MEESDSSDEENLQLLKEAADTQFINDAMFKDRKENKEEFNKREKLPSLRLQKKEEDFSNVLQVTPQFQQHVAKQLTKLLDEKLKNLLSDNEEENEEEHSKKFKSRVKLFYDSKSYIKLEETTKAVILKRKLEDSFSDNEEKCKSVAMSGENILSKNDIKKWSNRSKAKVFKYKKNIAGHLVLDEQNSLLQ